MTWPIRGLIEGFYGRPWTWDERVTVMRWCHERGMTHYLYAPKDDPLHRERWRDPYPPDELAGFARLRDADTLQVGFAISPGLSMAYDDATDRAALLRKLQPLLDLGIGLVCLALDDIEPRPGLGDEHARLTTWLRDELPAAVDLVLVPTEYTGTEPTPYLDALAGGVPASVPIAWTGTTVVCDRITVGQARARAEVLGGRPPLIWDNYPVNDAFMSDRLFLGPLRGRDPGLADVCAGYVANPMVQPHASLLPLASTAAYLRGDDPTTTWAAEADTLGVRAFAEACDGDHPRALVRAVAWPEPPTSTGRTAAVDALRAWLDEVAQADALTGPLADEAAPWVSQAIAEVGIMRVAIRLLRALAAGDRARAHQQGLALLALWPATRRAEVSVMGPRCSVRPVLGQGADGSWRVGAEAVTEDANATDALVRFALHELAAGEPEHVE